ncbi:TerC family protein [Tautonia plasticadhaerens]|uniref:TerC family protein n=1 Tax=Tautonia plasticadhaerens TaxID=2527974 RepID=UPI0018D25A41|nr:TerC family protein [Tautonia plasticadhaerens]
MIEALSAADWMTLGGTILTLVALEGLLSADNALVLAVMVRHLPRDQQKKALRYGIIGAFVFRFIAVLLAAKILDYWQLEVVGGLYLLQLAVRHLIHGEEDHHLEQAEADALPDPAPDSADSQVSPALHEPAPPASVRKRRRKKGGFWATVAGVELADIAFSIDSILAAVALADGLPEHLRDLHFVFFPLETWVIYIGGVLGIITMRYVAGYFLLLLNRFKGLAVGAYVLVGWIGIKLIGSGLHHALYREEARLTDGWRGEVPDWFARNLEMPPWFFWGVMLLILVMSMVLSPARKPQSAG